MNAIIGAAGAIGRAAASAMERRGAAFRVIGRDRAKLERAFGGRADIICADIADAAQIERAVEGVGAAVYAVGVPYARFELHPVLMRRTVDAARRAGVSRMVVVSSVYSYGVPQTARVAETHPREPRARKGRLRKEQEDIALAAHERGGLRTLVLRLPDFYGPHAELSLADQVFRAALSGQPANWIGSPGLPHEFVFVPDAGEVAAALLDREDCFGEAWNYGGPGAITGTDFIAQVCRTAGSAPRTRAVGPLMLRIGGLFNPLLRELVELAYLGTTPLILDDSKLEARIGPLRKTPYAEGIRQTVEWYRSRSVY